MDVVYLSYLRLMLYIAAGSVLLGTLLFIAKKAGKRGKPDAAGGKVIRGDNHTQTIVDSGNASIFFDKRRNAILIPYVPDKYKSGKATTDIIQLDMPYLPDALGRTVKNAMISCKKGKPAENGALMDKLGSKGWKEFTEGKLSISVYYREGRGIMMNSTVRTPEGAYLFTIRGPEICLPPDVEDSRLGDAILELLKKCR